MKRRQSAANGHCILLSVSKHMALTGYIVNFDEEKMIASPRRKETRLESWFSDNDAVNPRIELQSSDSPGPKEDVEGTSNTR